MLLEGCARYGGGTPIVARLRKPHFLSFQTPTAVAASSGLDDPLLTRRVAAAYLPAASGVFVGRQRELRALRTMLESAPGTGPALALITGPGGVGKSTLTAQAVTRYGGTYKAALTLSCAEYQGLELFLQRIGEFLKRQGAAELLEQTLPDPKLSTATKIEAAIEAFNAAGPSLLVVDNLESVQQEDRTLADPELLHVLQKLPTNLHGGRGFSTGRCAGQGSRPHGRTAVHS